MDSNDLYQLELLSLVAKITQEIENHTGLSEKTLAEFVINLHEQSSTFADFVRKLKDVGADYPESFMQNMDRLILRMHPKFKKKTAPDSKEKSGTGAVISEPDSKRRMFPGLAKPDQDWEATVTKDLILKEVDDMMSQFETAARRPKVVDAADERPAKRIRMSASSPSRRDPDSPRRASNGDWRNGRSSERHSNWTRMDDQPVLFKIYEGKVAGTRDFGAFVRLEGVAGRVEGTFRIRITSSFSLT
jgi:ATP-dependent RNA helicase DHX8/PRP22